MSGVAVWPLSNFLLERLPHRSVTDWCFIHGLTTAEATWIHVNMKCEHLPHSPLGSPPSTEHRTQQRSEWFALEEYRCFSLNWVEHLPCTGGVLDSLSPGSLWKEACGEKKTDLCSISPCKNSPKVSKSRESPHIKHKHFFSVFLCFFSWWSFVPNDLVRFIGFVCSVRRRDHTQGILPQFRFHRNNACGRWSGISFISDLKVVGVFSPYCRRIFSMLGPHDLVLALWRWLQIVWEQNVQFLISLCRRNVSRRLQMEYN